MTEVRIQICDVERLRRLPFTASEALESWRVCSHKDEERVFDNFFPEEFSAVSTSSS
jgi:hypothetical protein